MILEPSTSPRASTAGAVGTPLAEPGRVSGLHLESALGRYAQPADREMISRGALRLEVKLTPARIVGWMVAVVVFLGLGAYWDERREADAALADFGHAQVMVAEGAAETIRAAWDARVGMSVDVRDVAKPHLARLERPGQIEVLLNGPHGLETLTGDVVHSSAIEARFSRGLGDAPWVRLTHPEAVALGLPERTAIVGLAEVSLPGAGRWGIAVAATARRERDREERGLWRVGLGFLLASTVVVTFGTLALRRQREDLGLAQRLAVAEAVQARDERLVRADKLATLGAMAMGIAHQVATPLSVIMARAQRLAPRVSTDARAQRAVAAITEQTQRINEIVRAFLQLARGGTPTLVHANPLALVHGAVELVGHRFDKAGVSLRVQRGDKLPEIACDPRLFEQVLVNLLLNACDACRRGGAVVLQLEASDGNVVFTVEDDGIGISSSAVQRATEPFFTTKEPGEGSGLGLAIAQEIVGHHHGTLEIAPLPGRGTRARVVIPIASREGSS
jgi:two-component system, NtrC family, sensor kinase